MGTKAITAENLVKYYGKARGIDGLNLEVETGDFFGFIGPNGAGGYCGCSKGSCSLYKN